MTAVSALGQGADAIVARPPRTAVFWAIAAAGCAAAASVTAVTYVSHEGSVPHVHAGLVGWITLAYVACGLVAWWYRPGSGFGRLLAIAGFGPLVSRLSELDAEPLHSIGSVGLLLPAVLFLHVFLAYPSGRLERRFDRRLVLFAYVTTVGFGLASAASEAVGGRIALDVSRVLQRGGTGVFVLVGVAVLAARSREVARRSRGTRELLLACYLLALVGMAIGIWMTTLGAGGTDVAKLIAFGLVGTAPVLLLIGHLRARLARSAVGDLFVELRSDPPPAELRDALARALRDPSLELAYWLPEFGTYADLTGQAVELPQSDQGRGVTFVERDGARVAALVHDPALEDEQELLEAVTAAAGIAVENGRLHAELRARLEELRGSRARIVDAGQKERQRLERDLHDGAQQRLIALSLELRLLEESLAGDAAATARLATARAEVATSLAELRDVARGIHPAVVTGHGLEIALEQMAARAPVPVRLKVEIGPRLPERLEVAAFYLVSESLANIGKHAQASSARVELVRMPGQVVIEVVDDGVGGADTERGSGLRGLADRVEALEGRLRIWSPAGRGTRVRAEIPCAS